MTNVKKWESSELGITIEVDYDKCTGVGECAKVCPTNVYDIVNGKAVAARIDECIQCCVCVAACPNSAIKHSSCE